MKKKIRTDSLSGKSFGTKEMLDIPSLPTEEIEVQAISPSGLKFNMPSVGDEDLWTGRRSTKARYNKKMADVKVTYEPDMTAPFSGNGYGEMTAALTPSDEEDFDYLRESFQIFRVNEQTLVFAVAIDKENQAANILSAIRCSGAIPFGGYVHDNSRDAYLVSCVEYLQIGSLPFTFLVTMANMGEWKMKVPIPEKVLARSFSPQQKKGLETWSEKFKDKRYEIHFLQMIGCH